jgi:hypothetical protein
LSLLTVEHRKNTKKTSKIGWYQFSKLVNIGYLCFSQKSKSFFAFLTTKIPINYQFRKYVTPNRTDRAIGVVCTAVRWYIKPKA